MRIFMMFVMAASLVLAVQGVSQTREQNTKARQSETVNSLTGVIDQKGDKWVIATDETSMRPAAVLRSGGFKETNFGRYVGVRVRVKGKMIREGNDDVFVVSKLSDIEKVDPN